jgi:hypothetical protein
VIDDRSVEGVDRREKDTLWLRYEVVRTQIK